MKNSSWIIAGLIVVLGLVYWFTKDNGVSVGVKKLTLPVFESEKVDRIEIKSKGDVRLIKEADKWWVDIGTADNPRRALADENNIKALLDAAISLKPSHYVTNLKDKYKDLGLLGEGATDVAIYIGDKVVWSLVLGNNDSGSGKYAKLPEGEDVFVVRGSFWPLTRNNLNDWRNRQIITLKEDEVTSLKIDRSGINYLTLDKDDKQQWTIDRSKIKIPTEFREDKEALAALVRAVLTIEAQGFVDDKKHLSSPLISIHAVEKSKTHTLEIFKADGMYWVKQPGVEQIFEVNKFAFDRINKSIDELRDLSLLKFDKASIVKLTLRSGKEKVVVVKKDSNWSIEQPAKLPPGFEFDPNSVDDMLALLSGLQAIRIGSGKDTSQNPKWQQDWLVELSDDKGATVKLYADKNKASKDEYVVKGNIDNQIYVIKTPKVISLTHGVNAFKKEEFSLPPIDENTPGFESLPPDVQRKLLDATKKK